MSQLSKKGLFDWVVVFESGLSVAEWAWRIATLVFVGGSGTVAALVAKSDPMLRGLGPIYWIAVGLVTSLLITIILFLIKSSQLKDAERSLHNILATPRSSINPLAHSFVDSIIPVEDLRLPTLQLHENKQFKRCKFVGPAALGILGGTYYRSGFSECGDIIALPNDVMLTGLVVLKNCTVEDCEFIRITVCTDQHTAKGFSTIPGATVKGRTT